MVTKLATLVDFREKIILINLFGLQGQGQTNRLHISIVGSINLWTIYVPNLVQWSTVKNERSINVIFGHFFWKKNTEGIGAYRMAAEDRRTK